MLASAQIAVTADCRIRVGDRVTVTTEWAARLVAVVYPGRTVEEIRAERAGRVLEIWTGGLESEPWTVVRIDSAAVHPWSTGSLPSAWSWRPGHREDRLRSMALALASTATHSGRMTNSHAETETIVGRLIKRTGRLRAGMHDTLGVILGMTIRDIVTEGSMLDGASVECEVQVEFVPGFAARVTHTPECRRCVRRAQESADRADDAIAARCGVITHRAHVRSIRADLVRVGRPATPESIALCATVRHSLDLLHYTPPSYRPITVDVAGGVMTDEAQVVRIGTSSGDVLSPDERGYRTETWSWREVVRPATAEDVAVYRAAVDAVMAARAAAESAHAAAVATYERFLAGESIEIRVQARRGTVPRTVSLA